MSQTTATPRRQLKRSTILFNVLWTFCLVGAFAWGISSEKEEAFEMAKKEALASINKDLVYRRWAAGHGGVYVPITKETPPNPFLQHIPERDITTPSGRHLTLINPAYMTRQVYELAEKQYGVLGHITSLNPIRPENKPDAWEKAALTEFAKGIEEITGITQIDGKPYLRYMKRLITEDRCLKCHTNQGYQEGDVRGGISASVPLSHYYQVSSNYIGVYSLVLFPLWLIGIFLFNFGSIMLNKQLKSREKTEEKFRNYVETSQDLIWECDHKGRFTYLNPAWEQVTGYNLSEMLGKPFTDFLLKEEFEKSAAEFAKHLGSGFVKGFPSTYISKNGAEISLLFNAIPLYDSYNNIIGTQGSAYDITKRKQAEAEKEKLESQLIQSRRMEAIGTLAGGIAHDFNNILGVILGYTEMAIDDAPPESIFSQDLDKIYLAGHRAKELVKQILTFSRQTQVEKIPLQPQEIIKEALKLLRSSIPTTIEIKENISSDCGTILADPTQIHQILMNVCTNAFHAMEEKGGVLEVTLRKADTPPPELTKGENDTENVFIELCISDTGYGMGPDTLARIFEPFFTTKEMGKGTGMGLAITYGIVKEYGGLIAVDSEVGKGTTFHIYLPKNKKEISQIPEEESAIPTGTERILFIDDEELLVDLGKAMLEKLGYRVTATQKSLEALEIFQNQPDTFDLVITDQNMPGISGLDLARKMIQIRPGIPIILCTGYSSMIDEDVVKAQGIKEFILKPITKNSISKIIRCVLDTS